MGTTLRDADLNGAHLQNAILYVVDFTGADLHGADLRGAKLSDEQKQLAQAKSLQGATMPDGSIHP